MTHSEATRPWFHADALLRGEGRYADFHGDLPWRSLIALLLSGGVVYGAAMGSFGGSALQMLYSALKVPMLLGVTTLICLPSFFVANTLLGLRADFSAAFGGIIAAQATLAIALAALAPVTLFVYHSTLEYEVALLFNGLPFALATLAGQLTLIRHYRPLERRRPRHRVARYTWLVLYVFVAIQMAWVLRPYVGAPNLPTHFFREEAWSNAYVNVGRAVLNLLAD